MFNTTHTPWLHVAGLEGNLKAQSALLKALPRRRWSKICIVQFFPQIVETTLSFDELANIHVETNTLNVTSTGSDDYIDGIKATKIFGSDDVWVTGV